MNFIVARRVEFPLFTIDHENITEIHPYNEFNDNYRDEVEATFRYLVNIVALQQGFWTNVPKDITRDESELIPYEMPITKIIESNSISDINHAVDEELLRKMFAIPKIL